MGNMDAVGLQAILVEFVDRIRQAGSWAGETHIQKGVFFLQKMLGVPTPFEFVLYKHGPYSFDLHDQLADMRAHHILGIESRFPYGPSFRSGDLGQRTKLLSKQVSQMYEKQLDFVAHHFSTKDVGDL